MINKNKIIKNLSYEHPLFTTDGVNAQKRKREISGQNNTYFVVHIGTMVFMRMVWLVH